MCWVTVMCFDSLDFLIRLEIEPDVIFLCNLQRKMANKRNKKNKKPAGRHKLRRSLGIDHMLLACFGHFQSALMLQVVRFGSKNSKISITEGLFWTFPQRVIEKAEKQAEQSREKMPELKRRKRADLFNQKQYQKEDTGLSVYGAKSSKKSKKNSETDLKDLSLTEITNIKPNL